VVLHHTISPANILSAAYKKRYRDVFSLISGWLGQVSLPLLIPIFPVRLLG